MSRPKAARSRIPLLVGIAASAVVHFVILLTVSPAFERDSRADPARDRLTQAPLASPSPMQVIPLPRNEYESADPAEPEEVLHPAELDIAVEIIDFVEDLFELPPLPPNAADRLRPNFSVPELWLPLEGDILALSMEASERLVLGARLAEWFDSLAVADAEERALTDWTYTDDDGKRWGAADGMIYLGDFAIPVPFGFGVSPGRREEISDRMWQWNEIQRQAALMCVVESWKERQEAMRGGRERIAAEAAAKADTGRVGSRYR